MEYASCIIWFLACATAEWYNNLTANCVLLAEGDISKPHLVCIFLNSANSRVYKSFIPFYYSYEQLDLSIEPGPLILVTICHKYYCG